MSSQPLISRIILGVACTAGAALGLIYLYYKTRPLNSQRHQKPKEKLSSSEAYGSSADSPLSLDGSSSANSKSQLSDSKLPSVEPPEVSEPSAVAMAMSQSLKAKATPPTPGPEVTVDESDFDRDRNSITRDVTINRDAVAGLIGKKGCNIKDIQRKSNTDIKFKDSTLDNGDRVCQIRGSLSDVIHAESLIEKFMTEQPVVTTQYMSVPLSSVGRIIGQGGSSIRAIQDASKARVNVDPKLDEQCKVAEGLRVVTIKGTADQIDMARLLILEKVEEEKSLRKRIDIATASRTPRRGLNNQSANNAATEESIAPNISPLKSVGVTQIFVSCVYHPNNFWIQVMGRDSIELDKLCETMTSWYLREDSRSEELPDQESFVVGDLVAAPYDDNRMYRGKITRINGDMVNVIYVDYGDNRDLSSSKLRVLQPEFLHLRFQAIEATLNLDCGTEKWSDEIIDCFCDLTYCAQWKEITGRVKDFLKDPTDNRDVIWMELLDKELNIGDELMRRGYAQPRELPTSSSSSMAPGGELKKTYATVTSGENSPSDSSDPSDTLATASGFSPPTDQQNLQRNGN